MSSILSCSTGKSSLDSFASETFFFTELRRGLFCTSLYFLPDELEENNGETEFRLQLCGSQSSKSYALHVYSLDPPTRSGSRKRKKHCESTHIRLLLKPVIAPATSSSKNSSSEKVHQQQLQLADEVIDKPMFVWLANSNNIKFNLHLTESSTSPGSWRLNEWEFYDADPLQLWIDFGTSTAGHKKIRHGLVEMFNNQVDCDVKFVMDDKRVIGGHLTVLKAGSPVFAAMFQVGFQEATTRRVEIADMDFKVFRQLLYYLYTGESPQIEQDDITEPLFVAADRYGVELLKKECARILMARLNNGNVLRLLVFAQMQSIPPLLEACLKFIANHGRLICFQSDWVDFTSNHPDLCVEATRRIISKFDRSSSSFDSSDSD